MTEDLGILSTGKKMVHLTALFGIVHVTFNFVLFWYISISYKSKIKGLQKKKFTYMRENRNAIKCRGLLYLLDGKK